MPAKNQIIIFGVLCVVAFGLGYWDGMPEKDSGQRAEGVAPTIVTNVVTNTLREVVTNIVRTTPQPTPAQQLSGAREPQPFSASPSMILSAVEAAIRKELEKPTGELTKADYEKVTGLNLGDNKLTELPKELEKLTQLKLLWLMDNQLTSVKGLEKLTQLRTLYLEGNRLTSVKGLENLTQLKRLHLYNNPALTKAQIAELQKALPNCEIRSNPKK